MGPWKMQLASLPDKERLVAEIYYEGELWAEISQEGDAPVLEIYPRRRGKSWELDLESALEILTRARDRLLE